MIKLPIFGEVTTAQSNTAQYTSQTITPVSLASGVLTVTKADVGGDSGASLSVNSEYILRVDGDDYWYAILDDTNGTQFLFRVITTFGAPSASTDITSITEVTPSEVTTTLQSLITNTLSVEHVAVDEDWTIKNETIIFANATAATVNLNLQASTEYNDGQLLVVNADVGANTVNLDPPAGVQVNGGGDGTAYAITGSDATAIFVHDKPNANWKLVLTV